MRVTFNSLYNTGAAHMQSTNQRMQQDYMRVLNGRQLINPENDVRSYSFYLKTQQQINILQSYGDNADKASHWLTESDSAVGSLVNIINTIKNDYAIQGANDTLSASDRSSMASAIKSIMQQVVGLSNTDYLDHYIFGGFGTGEPPFVEGSNDVKNIRSSNNSDGALFATDTFSDVRELPQGDYRMGVTISNGMAEITLYDKYGNAVPVDSNSSDDATSDGNKLMLSTSVAYEPGKVVNLGRGMAIKLPENTTHLFTEYHFTYVAGSDITYKGDSSEIVSQIGSNSNVALNVSGNSLFMSTYKTLQSAFLNTYSGLPINLASVFSGLDGVKTSPGDAIKFRASDHYGHPVGNARVSGTSEVNVNLADLPDSARITYVRYGSSYYKVELEAKNYGSVENLSDAFNVAMKTATFAGSSLLSPTPQDTDHVVDISGELRSVADGQQLMIMTNEAGDKVSLSAFGDIDNALGFDKFRDYTGNLSYGKDNEFNMSTRPFTVPGGNEFLQVTADNTNLSSGTYNYTINGNDYTLTIPAGSTALDIQFMINKQMSNDTGFSIQSHVVATGVADVYDITYTFENENYGENTSLSIMSNGTLHSATLGRDYTAPVNKSFEDLLNFANNFYNGSALVSINSVGQVVVEDLYSGSDSRLSLSMTPDNRGIDRSFGYTDQIISGSYDGQGDMDWDVSYRIDNVGGRFDLTYSIVSQKGGPIASGTVADYKGGPVELKQGISWTPPIDAPNIGVDRNFTISLSGGNNLRLGEMHITEQGSNVNIFNAIQNLEDALSNNVRDNGDLSPSEWALDPNNDLLAKAFFSGNYTGYNNDTWGFNVNQFAASPESYLQDELRLEYANTTLVSPALGDILFDVEIWDNDKGTLSTIPVQIPATSYPTGMTLKQQNKLIIDAINNDTAFKAVGIVAHDNGGTLVVKSGAGTSNINLAAQSDAAIIALDAGKPTGAPFPVNLNITAPQDMTIKTFNLGTNTWVSDTITIPANNYADVDALATEVNNQIAASAVLNTLVTFAGGGDTITPTYTSGTGYLSASPNNPLGVGYKGADLISPVADMVNLDLSKSSVDERTLTFRYMAGTQLQEQTITIPNKDYSTTGFNNLMDDLATELASAGLDTFFTAVRTGDKGFGFVVNKANTTVGFVEGNHDPRAENNIVLGFARAGSALSVAITDSAGRIVDNINIKTANKNYFVADGISLGFDSGSVMRGNSFTTALGSGVQQEIDIFDKIASQVNSIYADIGNRGNIVSSQISFNERIGLNLDQFRSNYLGSTENDIYQITNSYQQSMLVYETALQATSRIIGLSLMNYI